MFVTHLIALHGPIRSHRLKFYCVTVQIPWISVTKKMQHYEYEFVCY